MNSQVESVTKTCELCQQTNISKRKEPYGLRPVPQQPFSEVSVDHKSLDNGYYCLVILDIHSRYPDVAFVKSTSFEANKEPLLKYFSSVGSDEATNRRIESHLDSFSLIN